MIGFAGSSRRVVCATAGVSLSLRAKKVTKETLRRPRAAATRRFPALLGPSRYGAGTRCAQTPAPLRPRRTCGARLAQGGLEGQDQQQEHPRMAWIYWVWLLPQKPAPLRPRRTCGARLAQGGLEGQDQQQEHPRMAWIYWVWLLPQKPAPLRPRRTCGARLAQGGLEGQDQQQEHPRMAWIYWVLLLPLTLGPPFSEPSIAGESGA